MVAWRERLGEAMSTPVKPPSPNEKEERSRSRSRKARGRTALEHAFLDSATLGAVRLRLQSHYDFEPPSISTVTLRRLRLGRVEVTAFRDTAVAYYKYAARRPARRRNLQNMLMQRSLVG